MPPSGTDAAESYHGRMSLPRFLLRLVLGRRLPIASGELRVRGPSAPITVRRDAWGVPHIDAQSDFDAVFALGFCHGQDRGGQLELLWRVGRGRLAEWVGPPGLSADRMSRRIGFRRSGEQQLPVLSAEVRSAMDAYSQGVNAGRTTGLSAKPHEFAILGGEPSAWDAADVLAVLKLQSFLLPSNWDVELARLRILRTDGAEALLALDPVLVGNPVSALETGFLEPRETRFPRQKPGFDLLAADLAAIQNFLPRGGGSNNWTIAGSRTTSGKPLLASDPHLAPNAPGPWHLAHIHTPDWSATGAAMVGTPGFAIGHNGFAAWGITAGLTDSTDLFIETLGADGRSVREADGSFTPCELLREVIRVKGRADVVEDVLVTPRGPVVTPLFTDLKTQPREAIALRAVWLDPLPLEGFLGVVRSRSFDAFRHCFRAWPVLPLNVLYADVEGTIGWQLIGQLPVRKGGNGLLPRPAHLPDSGWEKELVPFEAMPFQVNPPAGLIATANQTPASNGSAFLGLDFIDAYRARTIADEIAKRPKWDVAACAELQISTRSMPWEELRDIVLAFAPTDPQAREALDMLRAWDGFVSIDSPAAAVFELFVAAMCVRLAKAMAPNSWAAALGDAGLGAAGHNLFADRRVEHFVKLMREQPAGWFQTSWGEVVAEVLGGIVRKLRKNVGPSAPYWAWGHLRTLRLEHHLFGKHWLFGRAFNLGPVPCGGDQNTISQAGTRPIHPTDFTHNMANLRTVFDLADLSKSAFVLCGGQSGNPCSPHHADQLPLWQSGETIAIPWKQEDVIRAAKATLRLVPINPLASQGS